MINNYKDTSGGVWCVVCRVWCVILENIVLVFKEK